MNAASGNPARRRPRWGTLALVVLFHLLVLAGLVQAFAPNFTSQAVHSAASMLVTVTTREVPPPPSASPKPDEGASAAKGKKAKPKPVSAPKQTIPVKPTAVPPVASTGTQTQSGASAAGAGTGGGGEGVGTGSGNSGSGPGSGVATKPVLISGSIQAAKDFPIPPGGREERIGRSVIIAITVGTDGVPTACRTYRSSGLPETDRRTCELAMERLHFRPAMNARGEPVVATFYWEQRFFE
jgi:protein TonB